jgi:hypothetical protein
VVFVGVFVQDTEADAREFLRAYPMSFPTGHDRSLSLATALGFRAMPYTVVVSRQGEIARRFVGPVSDADLVATIEALRSPP